VPGLQGANERVQMRIARKIRKISSPEMHWAAQVFADSLPAWGRIAITDGLGPLPWIDNPYTNEAMGMFHLNVGPDYYPDLSRNTNYGFGTCLNVLIHELTHVWPRFLSPQHTLCGHSGSRPGLAERIIAIAEAESFLKPEGLVSPLVPTNLRPKSNSFGLL
jgi:hypothetical protein